MQAILFLASRSRYHIPRVGGFVHAPQFAELTAPNQPIVYQGRALDMDEFNKAAAEFLDRKKNNIGYDVSARLVGEGKETAPVERKIQPVEQAPVVEAPVESATADDAVITPPDYQPFTLEGADIYYQGQRVATIHESGLRCAKGYADLREQIEAWLESKPQ